MAGRPLSRAHHGPTRSDHDARAPRRRRRAGSCGPAVAVVTGTLDDANIAEAELPGFEIIESTVQVSLAGDVSLSAGENQFERAIFTEDGPHLDLHLVGLIVAVGLLENVFTEAEREESGGAARSRADPCHRSQALGRAGPSAPTPPRAGPKGKGGGGPRAESDRLGARIGGYEWWMVRSVAVGGCG
jgi:hypothetical protein